MKRFRSVLCATWFAWFAMHGALQGAASASDEDAEALRRRVGLIVLATEEYRGAFDADAKFVDAKEREAAEKILEKVREDAPSEELDALLELVRAGSPVEAVYEARDEWYEEHGLGVKPARPERALSRSDGKALYDRYCVACHGESGRGDGPASGFVEGPEPANFLDEEFMADETPEEFFQAISLGVPGAAMPEWGGVLEPQERWDLVAYLWSLRSLGVDAAGARACTECHRGDGPAADFTAPGSLADRSDRDLAGAAQESGAHADLDSEDLRSLVQTARLFDLAADGASVVAFERRQIPRMLDLLVEEYASGVRGGEVVDELEYFEAQAYRRRLTTDIENAIGSGGHDSASVSELTDKLGRAVDAKAPLDEVRELAERLKKAVEFNLSDS